MKRKQPAVIRTLNNDQLKRTRGADDDFGDFGGDFWGGGQDSWDWDWGGADFWSDAGGDMSSIF